MIASIFINLINNIIDNYVFSQRDFFMYHFYVLSRVPIKTLVKI